MKYFDAFAGIGGFALGIQRANNNQHTNAESRQTKPDEVMPVRIGETLPEMSRQAWGVGRDEQSRGNVLSEIDDGLLATCVGFSEIDKYASSVYQRHFGGHKPYGDIAAIDTADIPDFDILVGGFPCQAFSIAGKRGGFEDTRGTLFFELARILADKKPGYFCFENVKGLLSHDKGRTFKTIITTLDDLGYDLQWQVLNSKHFGVPQNRERVFIVGNLRDRSRPQVFPFGASDQRVNDIKVAGTLDDGGREKRHESIRRVYDPDGLAPTIPTGTGGGVMPKILSPQVSRSDSGRKIRHKVTDIAPTIRATQYKSGDNQPKVATGARIRRLTPLECERLQAFPDHWTQHGKDGELISDSQRYKMCGNAVTVNVIQAIFERLLGVVE